MLTIILNLSLSSKMTLGLSRAYGLCHFMSLKGKVVIITGGARGIGKALSIGLAADGADIAIAEWKVDGVESLPNDIEAASGVNARMYNCDVSKEDDVIRMVESAKNEFGRIDVLINNAGVLMSSLGLDRSKWLIRNIDVQTFDKIIGINLRGTFLCAKAVLETMIAQGGGSIINVSSGQGRVGRPGFALYNASKFGVEGFTQALSKEVKEFNIAVNALRPTAMVATNSLSTETLPPDMRADVVIPEHAVPLAIFLSKQDGNGITGESISPSEWNLENGFGPKERWLAIKP